MGSGTEEDRLMLDYLLGRLTEEERIRLEEGYFQDDALLTRLEFLEDRLIDEYVNQELSPQDRADYESRFMASPRRLEKARLVQGLRLVALSAGHRSRAAPFWAFLRRPYFKAFVLAFASIMLVCGWWVALVSRSELARVRTSLERQLADSKARQQQLEQSQSARGAAPGVGAEPVIAFVLFPGLSRGAPGAGRLRIPQTDVLVRFQLKLPDGAPGPPYLVSLRTADGDVIWSERVVSSTGGELTIGIEGSVLSEGDFLFVVESSGSPGPTTDFIVPGEFAKAVGLLPDSTLPIRYFSFALTGIHYSPAMESRCAVGPRKIIRRGTHETAPRSAARTLRPGRCDWTTERDRKRN